VASIDNRRLTTENGGMLAVANEIRAVGVRECLDPPTLAHGSAHAMATTKKHPTRRPRHASLAGAFGTEAIVGVSEWVKALRAEILRLAHSPSNVLISGPSGTGKELAARAVHLHSPRASQPYIVIDCAAINGTLFASQVFGHVKGAFTGASHDSIGCFRAADGGTVLFDEIGELELEFQAKLLRVLQHRTVTPIGGHAAIPVDVRIIAATNRDLKALVEAGRFREDLYYRLNVISLKTLPLKDRPEDIDVLADHILAKIALRSGLPPKRLPLEWLDCMRRHNWPGNVRELENFLERIALVPDKEIQPGIVQCLCPGKAIASGGHLEKCSQTDELFDCSSKRDGTCPWRYGMPSDEPSNGLAWQTLADAERQHIVRTLEHAKYNQTLAAQLLGISRQQFCRKIKALGLDTSRSRPGRPPK
jgi:DNA-binding NtrC family response regulator